MFYRVTARLKKGMAGSLKQALFDDTIRHQKPDGQEIVDSMERAIVSHDGVVEWSEVCYCDPPLQHERHTVFDRYFDEISIEPVDSYQQHTGNSVVKRVQHSDVPAGCGNRWLVVKKRRSRLSTALVATWQQ